MRTKTFFAFAAVIESHRLLSALALLIAVNLGAGLIAFGPQKAEALETIRDITSAGPLTHVYLGSQLGCQVAHTGDTDLEFFPPQTIPGDCGTFVFVDGVMYAPDLNSHATASGGIGTITPFTPVSQSAITGTGTAGDPFKVITVVDAGATGIRITQTDSYVIGQESYRSDMAVANSSGVSKALKLYRAADCFLGGSDDGFGYANAATKAVACTKTANNTPADRIEQFSPITPADHYSEANYYDIWLQLGSHTNLPDTCVCALSDDNGIAVNWDRTVASGQSSTFSLVTTFSPLGNQPVVVSKTADAATSTAGTTNGYTITLTNPNATIVAVNTIQDTLPTGFTYVSGSSTGATALNPGIVGQVLTWTGPFTLAFNGTITLHFSVNVGAAPGQFFNSATATTSIDVVPASQTAPITVTAAPLLTPTVATTIHNAAHGAVTSVVAGALVHDSVTVTGTGAVPSGSVMVSWFPNNACTGSATATSAATPLVAGTVDVTAFTQSSAAVGNFAFRASYGGDSVYAAGTGPCEALAVTAAPLLTPTVVTTIHNAAHGTVTSVVAGALVHDSVTVTGTGAVPSGSVMVSWFPNNACTGSATATSAATPLVAGTVDVTAFTQSSAAVGNFAFRASYGGDSVYAAGTGPCEALAVTAAPLLTPTVVTTIHNAAHGTVTSVVAGALVHDSVTVTGTGAVPSGSVMVSWFPNNACTGSATATSVATPLVAGTVDVTAFTQSSAAAGNFAFRASYGGDSIYAAGTGPCEALTVTAAPVLGARVTICHRTGSSSNPWVEITVNRNALPAHIGHGDFVVDAAHPCPPTRSLAFLSLLGNHRPIGGGV